MINPMRTAPMSRRRSCSMLLSRLHVWARAGTGSPRIGLARAERHRPRGRSAARDGRLGRAPCCRSLVGGLTLAYERLDLPADPGLVIVTYSAEPGSTSEAALGELARWSATRARLSAVET